MSAVPMLLIYLYLSSIGLRERRLSPGMLIRFLCPFFEYPIGMTRQFFLAKQNSSVPPSIT